MMFNRRGDNDRVQIQPVQKLSIVGDCFDLRVKRAQMFQAIFVDIAKRLEMAVWQAFKVSNQERSPITAPNYPYRGRFRHIFRAEPFNPGAVIGAMPGSMAEGIRDSHVCVIRAGMVLKMILRSSQADM